MSFNPQEFIKIGTSLSEDDSEAHSRSVINRAYYGAFGYIKERLPRNFGYGLSVHNNVINFLKENEDKEVRKIGMKLETLFNKRKKADYHYDEVISAYSGKFSIDEANEAIELFNKIKNLI